MPESLDDLRYQLGRLRRAAPLVQIDIVDGKFAPRETWPYANVSQRREFEAFAKEEEGFPFWEDFDFEFDLMIRNPEDTIGEWILLGASRAVFHIESSGDLSNAIEEAKRGSVEVGVALNTDTSNDALEPYLSKIDFVQFMGIAQIGFQGEPFDERVISKIEELRRKHPETIISVDGGVNLDTASLLLDAGASRLAVGSAIMGSDDVKEAIKEFKALS